MKKTNIKAITILFALSYMVSYMTRINFGAIISEVETVTRFSREILSVAITGSFITYGIGQIISGITGDLFSPKRLVLFGLLLTASMNLLMGFSTSPYFMIVLWCINGFAQSFMWPPMVKLMVELLSVEEYKKASVKVSWGSSFGTILVYLISPFIIMLSGWRGVFFFSFIIAVFMAFIWKKNAPDVEKSSGTKKEKGPGIKSVFVTPAVLIIMFAIVMQGMLRDGVTTWMPTIISQTYNMSNIISILSGVILPLFSILSFSITSWVYREKIKNPVLCAGVFFLGGTIVSASLVICSGVSAVASVLLMALLTGCMHGVNLILICMIPPYFSKTGNISTVSGVFNSCTYIGSALSTYGFVVASEKLSWNFTIVLWVVIAALGALACFFAIKGWNKEFSS